MASSTFRTFARTAAVAGALGLVASFGAPAASAQSAEGEESPIGSLTQILDLGAVVGSVGASVEEMIADPVPGEPSTFGSLAPMTGNNSVEIAVGSLAAQDGSLGELGGLLIPEGVAGSVSDSLAPAEEDDESPFGSIDSASLGAFMANAEGMAATGS